RFEPREEREEEPVPPPHDRLELRRDVPVPVEAPRALDEADLRAPDGHDRPEAGDELEVALRVPDLEEELPQLLVQARGAEEADVVHVVAVAAAVEVRVVDPPQDGGRGVGRRTDRPRQAEVVADEALGQEANAPAVELAA